jgi:flagellin
MPQMINTNIASLNAQRNLDRTQSANQQAMERLSSGLRINSAKDDAAGLAISTRFTSQINGLGVAVRNAGDGIALAQTAEGALSSVNDNLQRIRELAVQSANATNSDVDREALQAEVEQLVSEISRTAEETDFNGRKLLDGSFSATFQIGANAGQTVDVSIDELTSDRLGASSQSGLSARGTDNALENGDLIINGVAIAASKAEDDSASTNNNSASAISKAAAINRYTEETGVTAYVNENVAAGSEMAGASGGGTFSLNGVDIDFSTTTDTASTRAAITQAINAASEQTGVMAVDTNSAATGINLVAEDGRNIQLSYDTANLTTLDETTFASATGLAGGATNTTGTTYSNTYEGGYTLVADGDQSEIEITGGNGTGRGDLNNAGLSAGSYDRATAVSVSDVVADTTSASTIGGGSLTNALARSDSGGTLITEDAGTITNFASTTFFHLDLGLDATFSVQAGGADYSFTGGHGESIAEIATSLDGSALAAGMAADVNFFERVDFQIDAVTTAAGGGSMTVAGEAVTLLDSTAAGYTTEAQLQNLMAQINAADFSATIGAEGFVVAELNENRDALHVRVRNESNQPITLQPNATTSISTDLDGAGGNLVMSNATYYVGGQLAYEALNDTPVEVTLFNTSATATRITASLGTFSSASYDEKPLTTKEPTSINMMQSGKSVEVPASPLPSGSTVAELAQALGEVDGVAAWEEVHLSVGSINLEVGDQLDIGGQSVSLSGEQGVVTLASVADSLNRADFSGQGVELVAELSDDQTQLNLSIRNFTDTPVSLSTSGSQGRGLSLIAPVLFVGEQPQSLSGGVNFASTDGQSLSVELFSPGESGEFFTGSTVSHTFSANTGLQPQDLLINGVSIGAASAAADTASAEYASDGTPILSSHKSRSAIALADAINQAAAATGVSAMAKPTQVVGGDGSMINSDTLAQFEQGDQANLYINGVSLGAVTLQADGSGGLDTDRARNDALNLINQMQDRTGVSATDNGTSLTLTAADGRNIAIAIDDRTGADASIGALFGLDAAIDGIGESTFGSASASGPVSAEGTTYETTYGTLRLSSDQAFTLEASSNGSQALDALGFAVGQYGSGQDGQRIIDIDISTYQGAQAAITAVDNALQVIAEQRADLGAVQNRLDSTVQNLEINSENLSSAKSQIVDADFAVATADMSRSQVLQQAGISVLAQANASSQQVLTLLEAG